MYLRKAKVSELDIVYSMGFDVWNDGQPFEEYLTDCRNSKKYQSGNWYVLVSGEQLVSSLIVLWPQRRELWHWFVSNDSRATKQGLWLDVD